MKYIVVNDIVEFSQLFVPSERIELSKAIIEIIEENLNNTQPVIKDIHIRIESADSDIIIAIKRSEFNEVLHEQLELFEKIEHYEDCARILKLIKSLKAGSIVQSLIDSKQKQL